MPGNQVKVALNDGTFIQIPGSSILKGGKSETFTFGQEGSAVTITLIDPTPAEARVISPPQRKGSRAFRMDKGKDVVEGSISKKDTEGPKRQRQERASVFSRLTVDESYWQSKRGKAVQGQVPQFKAGTHDAEAGPSGVKLSRTQRRNRNKRLYKLKETQKEVRDEASLLAKNPFFPLSPERERESNQAGGKATRPQRGPVKKEKEWVPRSAKYQTLSMGEELRETLRTIKRQGLTRQNQNLGKQLIAKVKQGQDWCPRMPDNRTTFRGKWRPNEENFAHPPAMKRRMEKNDHGRHMRTVGPRPAADKARVHPGRANWAPRVQRASTREEAPIRKEAPFKEDYHKESKGGSYRSSFSPTRRRFEEITANSPRKGRSHEDLTSTIQKQCHKAGPRMLHGVRVRTHEHSQWRSRWVPKETQSRYANEKGKAPHHEEALPKKEEKANKMIRGESSRPQSEIQKFSSQDEILQWLREDLEATSGDDSPVVSVHVIGTRLQTQRQENEVIVEEGYTSEQEIQQAQQEKDKQVQSLNAKLEEAMKAITMLTLEVQNLRTEAAGQGRTAKAGPSTSSQGQIPRTNSTAAEQQQSPQVEVNISTEGHTLGESQGKPPFVEQQQPVVPTQTDVNAMVKQAVAAALAASQAGTIVRKGRPYPEAYEAIPPPPGFVQPRFRVFDGTGNPRQHIAQYRASCGFLGGSQPLLLKLFVTSLSGIAFTWYSELPNDSVSTFDELEELFVARFASAQQRVNVGDLILERKRPNEDLPAYII